MITIRVSTAIIIVMIHAALLIQQTFVIFGAARMGNRCYTYCKVSMPDTLPVSGFRRQKTTLSQFSVPGLREIHRNLKQEKKNNSRESFFRKSPFCTFSCINPGFGGPLDKL